MLCNKVYLTTRNPNDEDPRADAPRRVYNVLVDAWRILEGPPKSSNHMLLQSEFSRANTTGWQCSLTEARNTITPTPGKNTVRPQTRRRRVGTSHRKRLRSS